MKRLAVALWLAGLGAVVVPGDVSACGGCFAPPSTVQVVTDHRMVLSVSPTQTTLWDQFRYTGRASEFSWILPIRYSESVRVRIADNAFLQAADNLTAPIVIPPTRPFNPCASRFDAGAFADAAFPAADTGVVVHREEVVGPYAVAIIGGSDPMAIREWLRANGYTVPPSLDPILEHYTSLRSDYVALRLRPGEGIDRMSPVRVTVPGYVPTLPLRMIAAGIADKVGLSLVVLGHSRIEAQNFPNGQIEDSDLTYDFSRPTSPAQDYLDAFNRVNLANGGRVWLTESATRQSASQWESAVRFLPRTPGPDGGLPPPADAGLDAGATDVSDPLEDVRVAFEGLGDTATVTRLRADLQGRMLDRDLILAASDRGLLDRTYNYGHVLNTPTFPACGDAGGPFPGVDGSVPTDGSAADGGSPAGRTAEGGIRCATTPGASTSGPWAGALAAVLAGLTLAARRRRR